MKQYQMIASVGALIVASAPIIFNDLTLRAVFAVLGCLTTVYGFYLYQKQKS